MVKKIWVYCFYYKNNKNSYYRPGEDGKGVEIPDHLKEESERRYKENQFNIVVSEMIALDRSLPDLRST